LIIPVKRVCCKQIKKINKSFHKKYGSVGTPSYREGSGDNFPGSQDYLKYIDLFKNHNWDDKEISSRSRRANTSGIRRTLSYAAMTKDEAQRGYWAFYEAIK
jgi:hypothetical protein